MINGAYDLKDGRKLAIAMEVQQGIAIRTEIAKILKALIDAARTASPVGNTAAWGSNHAPPAGYQPGRFAGSWAFFVGSVPEPPYGVGGGGAGLVEILVRWRPGMDLGIVNNSPQGRRLAYHKWSIQIPHNWVDLFIAEALERFR